MSLDVLFPDLFSKTFFLLGCQLLITMVSAQFILTAFWAALKHLAEKNKRNPIQTKENEKQNIKEIDTKLLTIRNLFIGLLVANFSVFFVLAFWGAKQALWISFSLFSVWSVLSGIIIGACLIPVDRKLSNKVLGITASITFVTALMGIYSHVDFEFLSPWLMGALILLILANVLRMFVGMSTTKQRLTSAFGVLTFTLYLIFDFNRLKAAQSTGVNSWEEATNFAIDIYLDIINLFLDLLDLLTSFDS